MAARFPEARCSLVVRYLRQPEQRAGVRVIQGAQWLAGLAA